MDKTLILNELQGHYKFKTDAEFARFLDITPQTLSNWKSRNTFDIEVLYTKCVGVNPEYLITGIKPMFKIDVKNVSVNRKSKTKVIEEQLVPLYDLEASAGLKELFKTSGPQVVLDTIKIPNLPKCDGAITVTGDSMYPLLKSGDTVLYKIVEVSNIFYGEMYLLSVQIDEWEEYITVKYVQKSELGNEYVKLVSYNQHHQPKDIPINSITAIGLIKASIRINTML